MVQLSPEVEIDFTLYSIYKDCVKSIRSWIRHFYIDKSVAFIKGLTTARYNSITKCYIKTVFFICYKDGDILINIKLKKVNGYRE